MSKPLKLNAEKLRTLSVSDSKAVKGGVPMSWQGGCESVDCDTGGEDPHASGIGTRAGIAVTSAC